MRSRRVANRWVVVVLAVGAALAACERGGGWDDPRPEAEFRSFLMHWFKNERKRAFDMIDPEDRERLTEPLKILRRHLSESERPNPDEMLVAGRVDNPYDIKSVDLDPPLERAPDRGDRVKLELDYQDGRSGSATMVWRDQQWFVDLAESTSSEPNVPSARGTTHDAGSDTGDERDEADNRDRPDHGSGEPRD